MFHNDARRRSEPVHGGVPCREHTSRNLRRSAVLRAELFGWQGKNIESVPSVKKKIEIQID